MKTTYIVKITEQQWDGTRGVANWRRVTADSPSAAERIAISREAAYRRSTNYEPMNDPQAQASESAY